ncbi:hypothetical protein Sbal117_2981 [Shewanella baltica OS117]|nr:hypothetical protein Sbal117_2981 [Shewanella baltica OS117]
MRVFQTYYLTVAAYTSQILNDLNYEYWDIVYGCCSQHLQKQAF